MVAMIGNWSFTKHCQYWEVVGRLRGTRDLPSWSGWCYLDGMDGFSFSGACFSDYGGDSRSRLSLYVSPKASGSCTCQSLAPCAQMNFSFLNHSVSRTPIQQRKTEGGSILSILTSLPLHFQTGWKVCLPNTHSSFPKPECVCESSHSPSFPRSTPHSVQILLLSSSLNNASLDPRWVSDGTNWTLTAPWLALGGLQTGTYSLKGTVNINSMQRPRLWYLPGRDPSMTFLSIS